MNSTYIGAFIARPHVYALFAQLYVMKLAGVLLFAIYKSCKCPICFLVFHFCFYLCPLGLVNCIIKNIHRLNYVIQLPCG